MYSDPSKLLTGLLSKTTLGPVQFKGNFKVTMLTKFIELRFVREAIPNRLALRTDSATPNGMHPVIVVFGSHHDVSGPLLPQPIDYFEAAIAVPNIEPVSGCLATFLTRVDVDNLIALVLGLSIGYRKKLSTITFGSPKFTVDTLIPRARILSSEWEASTGWKKPADFPKFAYIAKLLEQPIVSLDVAGNLLYSIFNWNLGGSQMQGARTRLSVPNSLPALPNGDYTISGFEDEPMGSGCLIVSWDLTGPFMTWPLANLRQ